MPDTLIKGRQSTGPCDLLLNHDYASNYTTSVVLGYLFINNAMLINNYPFWSYQNPCDFVIPNLLNIQLKGRPLESDEDARALVEGAFSAICQLMSAEATDIHLLIMIMCMIGQDEYFWKLNIVISFSVQ